MNENNVDKEKLDYLFNLIRMYEGIIFELISMMMML